MAKNVDIAIIVPKEDELRALEWAFRVKFVHSSGELKGGKHFYQFQRKIKTREGHASISIAVIFINDQGNSIASSITEQVLARLNPVLIFLIGTAAGKEDKVKIADIVVSEMVLDIQEWRTEKGESPRPKQHVLLERILTDANRFLGKEYSSSKWTKKFKSIPKSLFPNMNPPLHLWDIHSSAHLKFIASGNFLHLDPDKLRIIWAIDDRIRCYEMESAGFAIVCKQYKIQWLVVRGISDYGTPESKKDENRVAASLSAASFIKNFIERGLIECFPYSLRVPESEKSELSEDNFYAKFDILSSMKNGINEKLEIDLSDIDLGRSLSLSDFEALCVSRGADPSVTKTVLAQIREEYFTKKYLDYNYEVDLRGLIPGWAGEIKEIISNFSVDVSTCTALDVGVGNGIEIPYFLSGFKEVIGVDVSRNMLFRAKNNFPSLKCVHNPAEDMQSVPSASIDVYISLRTFQSSLFDVNLAVREANRVLKRKGLFIVSVANGFVEIESNAKRVVRGLLIPGTKRIVDKTAPMKFSEKIFEKLSNLGFEAIGYSLFKTDIYIWAQKP